MIPYLFKAILCSAFLYVVYRFLLENHTMHRFNRMYLLFGLILSLLIPLYTNTIITNSEPPIAELFLRNTLVDGVEKSIAPLQVAPTDYVSFVITAYLFIVSILLVRFVTNIRQLLLSAAKQPFGYYRDTRVILMSSNVLPHSFLHYIFVNEKDYRSGHIDQRILYHELAHVRQKHSFDILFIELLQVLFWINPLIILYKKSLQLNHEFLADQAVIDEFGDACGYQSVLLRELGKTVIPPLSSSSNYFISKKRLVMITKSTSRVSGVCRRLAVLPVFIAALFLFSNKVSAATMDVGLDTAINRILERNIPFPERLKAGETGNILLLLSKVNEQLVFRIIYSSYQNYGDGVDQNLTELANGKGLAAKLKQDEVIVPVVFQYFDEQHKKTNLAMLADAKKVIDQLGRNVDVSYPIVMVDFAK